MLILLAAPSAAAPAAAEIVVTTTADALNGNVGTAAGLVADPGPDGIALREAIEVTNNDPGSYTIRFAAALAGKTIVFSDDLGQLFLEGGGVTVEGDIDGNDMPDVTLRSAPRPLRGPAAFVITSSGNRLHALTLEGFGFGVLLQPHPRRPGSVLPSNLTFADNVISDLVIRGPRTGIELASFTRADCEPDRSPCASSETWKNVTLTGNTIETKSFGIHIGLYSSIGSRIEGLTVTDNKVRLGTRVAPAIGGAAIQIILGGPSTQTRISAMLIARNSIEAVNGDGGIVLASGAQRAQRNTIEGVRIRDNRIRLVRKGSGCCLQAAIVVYAGVDSGLLIHVRPVRYPDGNVVRDVHIAGNSVSGSIANGVKLGAGVDGGGSRNRIENVRIERNGIRSATIGRGVQLWTGLLFKPAYATGNRITGVKIHANRITIGRKPGELFKESTGGIVLMGGWDYSRLGVVRNVRITNNRIASARAGIRLIGGIGPKARGNSVTCVRLRGNRITGTRNAVVVTPNLSARAGAAPIPGRASGNRASLGGC